MNRSELMLIEEAKLLYPTGCLIHCLISPDYDGFVDWEKIENKSSSDSRILFSNRKMFLPVQSVSNKNHKYGSIRACVYDSGKGEQGWARADKTISMEWDELRHIIYEE